MRNWAGIYTARFLTKLVAQSCPTLWDPIDYSLPGSSVHGIFQAKTLEWGAIPFSRDLTRISCIASLLSEPPEKPVLTKHILDKLLLYFNINTSISYIFTRFKMFFEHVVSILFLIYTYTHVYICMYMCVCIYIYIYLIKNIVWNYLLFTAGILWPYYRQ